MKTMEWDSKKGLFVEKEAENNGNICGSCSVAEDLSEMESKVGIDNDKIPDSAISYPPKQKKTKKSLWQSIKELF